MLGLGLSITSVSGLRSLASKLLGILRSRSTYSENNVSSNATIDAIDNAGVLDDATILLTPTAYSNTRVHSVKTYTGDELVTNGTFDTDLSSWINTSTHWQWSSGSAYHPLTTSFLPLKQTLTNDLGAILKITFDLTYVQGTAQCFYKNQANSDVSTTFTSSGSYTIITERVKANTEINFGRALGHNTEFYIDNVSVLDVSSDFDFDRASSATRINSDGLVQDMQSITDVELVQNGDFEELGDEEITNGNFDNELTSWTAQGDSITIVDGAARIARTTSTTFIQQNVLTSGKLYKVEFDVLDKPDNNGTFIVRLGANNVYDVVNYEGTRFSKYITSSGIDFRIYSSSDNGVVYIDNVSVQQVDPNDEWTVTSSDANNYVEFTEGFARLKFLNTSPITMLNSTLVLEANKTYELVVDVHDVTSGAIKIDAGGLSETFNTEGVTTRYLKPTGNTTLSFYRATANVDITLASVSVKDITFADDVDLARINYDSNGENGHWLLEPTSTNLVPYSEDFTEYSISTTNLDTPTIVSITNPTGVSSSGLLNINNGVSASKFIYLAISTSSNIHTQSIFVKYVDRQWIQLLSGGTSHYANFDIQNGVVGNTSGCSSTIEDYGNGWYRCTATLDSAATPMNLAIAVIDDNTATRLSASTGTGSYHLFGGQVEALPYATSYIPSLTGSTVTRATETLNGSGNSTLINSTEGVLYAEIAALADDISGFRVLGISDGGSTNRIFIGYTSNNIYANVGAGTTIGSPYTPTNASNFHKVALKYENNNCKFFVDGSQIGSTITSVTIPSGMNSLQFDSGAGGSDFYGKCKALAVFDRALTDRELEDLTS